MNKKPEEWLEQAEYDIGAAKTLFEGGKYIYAVFMCHLSIEKALKGLYLMKLKEPAPKTHNLIYLIEKVELEPPAEVLDFLIALNKQSVPTRYPEDLRRMLNDFNKEKTSGIMEKCGELLEWIRKQY